MQQQTIDRAANSPGYALRVREKKMKAHADSCHSRGILFVPLIVETKGGWSDEAIKTISHIGCLQGQRLGSPPSEAIRHLFFNGWPSLCRGVMPLYGSIVRQPSLKKSSELDAIEP